MPPWIRGLPAFPSTALAQVFDFEEVPVWANSTRSMPTRSHGAVAMRNAAFLLIQLKAMGFRVDDAPLSSRIRPLLASKKVLVGREFYVFWQQELDAKREAFILYSAPSPQTVTTQEVTLPLGHTMRIISDGKCPIGHRGHAAPIDKDQPGLALADLTGIDQRLPEPACSGKEQTWPWAEPAHSASSEPLARGQPL